MRSSSTTPTDSDRTYHLSWSEARRVSAVVRYFDAYNSGDLAVVRNMVSPDIAFSDCNYATGMPTEVHGRDSFMSWVRRKVRDHDQLTVGAVENASADPDVVGVQFTKRSSDRISRRGHPHGITELPAAKIAFAKDGKIIQFPMAPIGIDSHICRL